MEAVELLSLSRNWVITRSFDIEVVVDVISEPLAAGGPAVARTRALEGGLWLP